MSEHITLPLLDEASAAKLPDNFFDDLMPLLEEFGPALAMAEQSWRIADQAKQEIHQQAPGRRLHPKDILLLQATEDNCTRICLDSVDPLIATGSIAQRAERVGKTARSLVSLITVKEPRKQKDSASIGINSRALSTLQASRIAGLGLQQIVHDELQAIAEIEELSSPLAVCLAKMVRREDPPLNTCEAELLRIAATIHKQNPRENFITDLYRSIASADEATNREEFLYEGLLHSSDRQYPVPPKLKTTMDVMRLHVGLFVDKVEDQDTLAPEQIQEAALERYVNWFKGLPWPPVLNEGLADFTAAKQDSLIQVLDADFTKHYIADREFYRTAPLSGVSN